MTNPAANSFGGSWTVEKLNILRGYLDAYTTALKNKRFKLIYVDAFAGTGTVDLNPEGAAERWNQSLLSEDEQAAILAANVVQGSARVALEVVDKPFDRLIFIEKNCTFAQELRELRNEFPYRDIQIENGDANLFLQRWCEKQNRQLDIPWQNQRAVVFLDPFATEVNWQTIDAISETMSVDLWILFPLLALSRILPNAQEPDESYALILDRVYGGPEWRDLYMTRIAQLSLLPDDSPYVETVRADQQAIVELYLDKLDSKFAKVSSKPRWFRNSRNSPLFAMLFAASNPLGADLAVRIADYLLLEKW